MRLPGPVTSPHGMVLVLGIRDPSLPLLYPVGVFGRLGGFTRMIHRLHKGGPLFFVAVCVEFGIGVCS